MTFLKSSKKNCKVNLTVKCDLVLKRKNKSFKFVEVKLRTNFTLKHS